MDPDPPTPTSLIIPLTVEVVCHATRGGSERANVFHYIYSGSAPVEAELATLCQEVETTIIEEQEDHTAAGTTWYKITAFDMASLTGAFHERSVLRLAIADGNVNSWQTAYCLSKRSGLRGRSNHGRYYNFDVPKNHINEDELLLPIIPSINDQAARMLEPRVGGRFLPAIASRLNRVSVRMTSITFDPKVDSQDRRSKGHGA